MQGIGVDRSNKCRIGLFLSLLMAMARPGFISQSSMLKSIPFTQSSPLYHSYSASLSFSDPPIRSASRGWVLSPSLYFSLPLITPAGSFFTHTICFHTNVYARVYTYMYMYFQTSIRVSFVRFDRIIRTNRFAINIDLSLVQLYNLSFSLFLFFCFVDRGSLCS